MIQIVTIEDVEMLTSELNIIKGKLSQLEQDFRVLVDELRQKNKK